MRYAGERAYDPRFDGPTSGVMAFLGAATAIICGVVCITLILAAQLW